MNKIKVLHYIWSANFGGIEKLVIDLTKAQQGNSECESSILIGCHKGTFIEKLTEEKVRHCFAFMKHGFDIRPLTVKNVSNAVRNVDIVHIHTYNPLIFLIALRYKKKIIYTVHGNFNFGRKVTFSDKLIHLQRKFFLNNFTDFISFNSIFTQNKAYAKYGLKSVKNKVVYNGIFLNLNEFVPPVENEMLLNQLKDKFVVGTSSRFAGFKRIDRLIEAFARFSENKKDVALLLVGDGPLLSDLKSQASKLNILDSVIFAGYQPNVRSFQNLMTICVFPSENEPFGLVAVETLSLGKPTLLFKDGGGMTEIFTESLKSDIVDNISEMTSRIESYYQLYHSKQLPHIEVRQKAASRFDIHTMEKHFFEIYKSILA
ncbi:MAG: glycosyltransferase family 4 protein [Bacteroidetes bacterium]|nr:glycosyltransferase family 4 protein [Bacteroidota bacterium]MBK9425015.1 glycosyltransferase family 4 protein [Bacteroidota bacterium]